MSPRRSHAPADILCLLSAFAVFPLIAVLMSILFPLLHALRRPNPELWLTLFYLGTAGAILGAALLFFAKLPQYRAGVLWRIGSRDLPLLHQRLYRIAFALIVPGCLLLTLLLLLASRVR